MVVSPIGAGWPAVVTRGALVQRSRAAEREIREQSDALGLSEERVGGLGIDTAKIGRAEEPELDHAPNLRAHPERR
jgi:hypothetical protein